MPNRGSITAAAPPRLFAVLGDETRLRLVSRLCNHGPTSITRLTEGFPITRQVITKHLRVMERAGLVRSSTLAPSRPGNYVRTGTRSLPRATR